METAKTTKAFITAVTPALTNVFTTAFTSIKDAYENEIAEVRKTLADKDKALDTAEGINQKLGEKVMDLNSQIEELSRTIETLKSGKAATAPKQPKDSPRKPTHKYAKDAIRIADYDDIKFALESGDHVFLAGDAGCGKSQFTEMLAEDLGLPRYLSSQVTQEYKIEGYQDAHGIFHSTEFIEAFTKGGLFVLEEADASSSDVLVIMNTALANGYMSIPGTGIVYAHKNFRCIATGNTFGTGADDVYVGRQPLDASTLDRFIFFVIQYDERIEMECSGGNREMVEFVHDLRKAVHDSGAHIMFPISYRGITKLAKYEKAWGAEKAIQRCIIKGLDADNVQMLAASMTTFANKYTRAFKACGRDMNKAAA